MLLFHWRSIYLPLTTTEILTLHFKYEIKISKHKVFFFCGKTDDVLVHKMAFFLMKNISTEVSTRSDKTSIISYFTNLNKEISF